MQTPTHRTISRVGILTGASAGIGLAIARHLTESGWRLVINGRRADRLDEVAAELNRKSLCAATAAGDAAEDAVIERMFAECQRSFGSPADTVIVNAGRGLSGSVTNSDPSQWEDMIRTNLLGAARLLRAAAAALTALPVDETPKDIVVIGSVVGRHVSPFSSMYGSTKFGVHGLTEGLRRELAPKRIRVSLVEPGFVVSEFQGVAGYEQSWFDGVVDRIGPVLQPEDVARAVGFMLNQPSHVHISDLLMRPTRQDYP